MTFKPFVTFLVITFFSTSLFAASSTKNLAIDPDNLFPKVKLETSLGIIIVELDRIKAPVTVDNFLTYVVEGEYNNTIFHRMVQDFVVQGGGYDAEFNMKTTKPDIVNESGNGLKNSAGTIAMAKENRPHTANRQFFINLSDNTNLDPGRQWGFAVFGEVIEGHEVLEAINEIKTDFNDTMGWENVPVEPLMLIKATLLPAS